MGMVSWLKAWLPSRRYPKAHARRFSISHPTVRPDRRPFFRAAGLNFAQLQIVFFALFAYIFAALFQQTVHVHNLQILFVDYGGGEIGNAVRGAYSQLRGDGFPTLIERDALEFSLLNADIEQQMREEVCQQRYWGAIFTSPSTEAILSAAGNPTPNDNQSHALHLVWNEALYPQVSDATIFQNIQRLSSVAENAYRSTIAASVLGVASSTSQQTLESVIAILSNPWTLNSVNIKPTTHGARLIYNSLVFILIMLQEFFYLGTINGLSTQFRIYPRIHPLRIITIRSMISISYTFVGSLCTTGMIWAFRYGWDVGGKEFIATWTILWLLAHVNFCILDVMTTITPPPYQPMLLVTWVMCNAASLLIPLELSPGFYRWAYALPAYETYQILGDIWSGGCNPKLHRALPILFSWEVMGFIASGIGVYRRCHHSLVAEELQEEAFQKKLNAAVREARKAEDDSEETEKFRNDTSAMEAPTFSTTGTPMPPTPHVAEPSIRRVATAPESLSIRRPRWSSVSYGPCFPLAFGSGEQSLESGEAVVDE
ncbi:hypothetical protein P152DRAFT_52351 [Eremomyces bilateralis CBS 781.70]|uniref:DUF3533 domain-containing protein n=1 Tax=Eremomyces bilateralis CBS 781.70 TaxID=1392243 RepID=A0A6G1G128_9PEZI|nr:uncharacterized protein P152DRAFT_52351 [Eremomyces bilateralis CBS 781.70]KAF1811815.1 hypothetical protein P152DRAFT_52351 [Eremomyces bilateralis CBS 781.70]